MGSPSWVKIADAQMRQLTITKDDALPRWNYTVRLA